MADVNTTGPAVQTQAANNNTGKGTINYKVEVTCYWNDILYRENDTVELPSNVTPPKEYFKKC
ncbi:MAG: hypothetical protein J6S67_21355 [Methanobrevibacter sp.]|nr:hypothetical protein [Methanobrevibacter sp.]